MDGQSARDPAPGVSGAADTWPLSARDAAAVLGISERTVRRAIGRGDLLAAKHGGVFRIDTAEVDRFERRTRPATVVPQLAQTPVDPSPENRRSAEEWELFRRLVSALSAIRALTGLGFVYLAQDDLKRTLAVQWEVLNVVQQVCARSLVDSLVNDDTTPDGGRWMSIVPSSTARIGEIALTRREVEVLNLMAMGESNRDIADSLYISIPTVKRHVTNILGKLGVSSRYEAASFARSNGFA